MEENKLAVFEFEHQDVECIILNDEPVFNPYHISKCLEMPERTLRDHLSRMNDKQKILVSNSNGDISHIRKMANRGELFLTESGVYKLIFKSRATKAEDFQDWVTDDVLPSIRKEGSYQLDQMVTKQLETTLHGIKILTGVEPEEIARVQNESWRAKLANLMNDIAKRQQTGTKTLYEKLYFLFASETGFLIPELAEKSGLTNSEYLKKNELSAKMLYEFALAYFYKDKRFIELISLNPNQRTLGEFSGEGF